MTIYDPTPDDVPINPICCRAAVQANGRVPPAQCVRLVKINGKWCRQHAPEVET